MKRLIAFISILMLVSSAYGTATSVTIYGTNKSNAQTNVTCYGCNQTISVQAWNTTYVKNISVHSRNGSGGDVVTFNISNVTGYQVQELKVNGTAINAYQAGANGMLNFTYTVVGNRTLVLSPALNVNGYNFTWGRFWQPATFEQMWFSELDVGADLKHWYIETLGGADNSLVIQASNDARTDGRQGIRIERSTYTPIKISIINGDFVVGGYGGYGGNVGIGTTSPTQKLDVAGGINATHMNVSGSSVFAPTTQATNATLSRGQDTVYQNGYKPMFLSIVTDTNAVERTIKTDANNPPTTVVSIIDVDTPGYAFHTTAVILPRNFYMLDSTSTVTISYWTEWT